MPLCEAKGHLSRVFSGLTHKSTATGEHQGLLDGWRVVADDVNDQLHVSGLPNLSVMMQVYVLKPELSETEPSRNIR